MTTNNLALQHKFLVEYKYSACIKIVTNNISILCDPWFSDTAYYGTWARYPSHNITKEFLGDFDVIWISHIHPDHYCPWTIEKIFDLYGEKKILVADWGSNKNYLKFKLMSDGYSSFVEEINEFKVGSTVLKCIPNVTGSSSDIDSCLIVYDINTGKGVLNLNDCIVSDSLINNLNNYMNEKSISLQLMCLGYTGAGPFPQTYYSIPKDVMTLKTLAHSKKLEFFDRYLSTISKISSNFRLPFAGKYLLSSELSFMNSYRGVADALELKQIDPNAIILDDSGSSTFNVLTREIGRQRDFFYDYEAVKINQPLMWNEWINFSPDTSLLQRLLNKAYKKAFLKSECNFDYMWNFFVFDASSDLLEISRDPFLHSQFLIGVNCNRLAEPTIYTTHQELNMATSNLFINRKALFGALTGVFHWNNLEVGSAFFVRRDPDEFSREAQNFLNFMAVI